MKTAFALLAGLLAALSVTAAQDTRLFEMRVYYAAPGKLDDLHARFRNHTLQLFAKHGMENLGYWVPLDNPESKLIYVLAYPDREARAKAWKAFGADPDWQAAYKASEVNGKLVAKAESTFWVATDYSPAIRPVRSVGPRVFELRTYTASPGNLDALNARFRDHTVALFDKHGIRNLAYWVPAPGEKDAGTLMYIVTHPSKDAAAAAFKAFGADPAWQAARKASEEKAGGSLTAPGGVKSVFMQATDYSPTR